MKKIIFNSTHHIFPVCSRYLREPILVQYIFQLAYTHMNRWAVCWSDNRQLSITDYVKQSSVYRLPPSFDFQQLMCKQTEVCRLPLITLLQYLFFFVKSLTLLSGLRTSVLGDKSLAFYHCATELHSSIGNENLQKHFNPFTNCLPCKRI
jgi:hypothetical protein